MRQKRVKLERIKYIFLLKNSIRIKCFSQIKHIVQASFCHVTLAKQKIFFLDVMCFEILQCNHPVSKFMSYLLHKYFQKQVLLQLAYTSLCCVLIYFCVLFSWKPYKLFMDVETMNVILSEFQPLRFIKHNFEITSYKTFDFRKLYLIYKKINFRCCDSKEELLKWILNFKICLQQL